MNILLINKFLNPRGGSESYTQKLGQALTALGQEVQYFGMDAPNKFGTNEVGAYVSPVDFHKGKLSQKLFYPFTTIYSREARLKLRKVLNAFCPDVVHINNFTYQLTPSILLEVAKWRKQTGRKCSIIFTAHDANLVCPNHSLQNPKTGEFCQKCLGGHFYHCLLGKCIHQSTAKSAIGMIEGYVWRALKTYTLFDAVVCPSHFVKTKLDTNPELKPKTLVLSNFFDCEQKTSAKKENYVLYFGRYHKEKGVETLLSAIQNLPHIPFVFAGSGDLEEQINALPNVHNVGFQKGEALYKLIASARFVVFPSTVQENCSLTVIESQMNGTPVLASNTGGTAEILEEGKVGEFFEVGNAKDLAQKINALWQDEKRLAYYTQNTQKVQFKCLLDYAKSILTLYKNILNKEVETK